ncbi:DUF1934 domain-containing protein [Calorimonas adulescens]|jgi:Domain of unknown function (DUF1934).|uniref:DUF1934 domain-containing protein n=1 Tax=Calorimonas adulescens TaxID=2606906 RepID=A0A5D8QDV9_9THEO|nr:DUF1934 domain-containing protein [Calorimonas adulescens]TZE82880.1 DUF1934 domain-containing protein [Calorimonas adulescens]
MAKAWVRAKGTQISPHGEESIELTTEAELYKNRGNYYIVYRSSPDTITTLKIERDRVVVYNSGRHNSKLVFEKDKKNVSPYVTSDGIFDLGVIGKKMHIDIGSTGGEVNLKYHLELNNRYVSTNELKLTVREVN